MAAPPAALWNVFLVSTAPVVAVIVKAASKAVLFMLTFEPLSPVALVKILTVFPDPDVLKVAATCAPAALTNVVANKLTPLNLVSLI